MLNIEIDENELRKLCLQKIDEHIKNIDKELVFWDSKELKRRTRMSWNTIQERFFFDPNFPKTKIGGKWYFPADKTKEFLIDWIDNYKDDVEEDNNDD